MRQKDDSIKPEADIIASIHLDSASIKFLRDLVVESAYKRGDEFFRRVVKELSQSIGADYTFVGRLEGDFQSSIEILAIFAEGGFGENFTYSLKDTPCNEVVGKKACIYPCDVASNFPKDQLLVKMGIVGYVGVPLFDSGNNPLGVMVGLYKSPIKDVVRAEAMLQLMANHTAGEIERSQLELSLKKSEERFRTYVEVSPVGIFIFDMKGKFHFFNKAAIGILDYRVEEALNLSIRDIVIVDKGSSFKEKITELFNKGSLKTEMTLKRRGGDCIKTVIEIITVEENLFLGFCTDISELTRMEKKLRQSEKMRAIGQLAGGIAHDFNNQLSGIIGYADLLKKEVNKNSSHYKKVKGILTASKRAADLTSNLLAFAREDRYISEVMDINEVILEVIDLLERSIHKRINIVTNLLKERPLVNGDPTQIQNLLLNLAINGRDAMPEGGKLIFGTRFIELDEEYCSFSQFPLVPGMYVVISVTDDGIGMDEDTLKRIFEPFFTTKMSGFGTGMGLAAAYGTVKAHQGEIVVDSNPGYGTTFEIILPLTEESGGAVLMHEDKVAENVTLKGHVLVIDDDESARGAIEMGLNEMGLSPLGFNCGRDASEYFERNFSKVDAVVLDLVLPDIEGIKLFKQLKSIDPDVKVVMTSGYNIENIAREVKTEGVNAVMQKPFLMSDIYSVLSDILG